MTTTVKIRDEARLFAWGKLYPEQQVQLKDGIALISAILERGDRVRKSGTRQPAGRAAQGLASIDDVRLNTTILIEGDRGVGKTTVLLHLLAYARRSRLNEPLTAPVAGGTSPFVPEKRAEHAMIESWKGRVIPLEILDLERLPAKRHPVHAIAQRLRSLIPSEEFERDGSTLVDAWFAFAQAAAIGIDGQGRHAETTLDQVPYELEREAKEHLHIGPAWQKLVDELIEVQSQGPLEPLFLVPIDDADLAHEHIGKVLETLRWLSHPRVSFLVGGTKWLFEAREQTRISEDLKIRDGEKTEQAERVRALAEKAIQKAFPAQQQISVTPIAGEAAVKALSAIEIDSDRTFGDLLAELPSLHHGVSVSARDIVDHIGPTTDAARIVKAWFERHGLRSDSDRAHGYSARYSGPVLRVGALTIIKEPTVRLSLGGTRLDPQASAAARVAEALAEELGGLRAPIEPSPPAAGLVASRWMPGKIWTWPGPVLSPRGHETVRQQWIVHAEALQKSSSEEVCVRAYLRSLADVLQVDPAISTVDELMSTLRTAAIPPGPDHDLLERWRDSLPLIALPEGGLSPLFASRLLSCWGILKASEASALGLRRNALLAPADMASADLMPGYEALALLFPDGFNERLTEVLGVSVPLPMGVSQDQLTLGRIASAPGLLTGVEKQTLFEVVQPYRSEIQALSLSPKAISTAARLLLRASTNQGLHSIAKEPDLELAERLTSMLGSTPVSAETASQEGYTEDREFRIFPSMKRTSRPVDRLTPAGTGMLLVLQSALADANDLLMKGRDVPIAHAAGACSVRGTRQLAHVWLPTPRFPSALDHAILSEWWTHYASVLSEMQSAGLQNGADNALRAWIGLVAYLGRNRDLGRPRLVFGNSVNISPIESAPKREDWHYIATYFTPIIEPPILTIQTSRGARQTALYDWAMLVPLLAAPEFGGSNDFAASLLESSVCAAIGTNDVESIRARRVAWLVECRIPSPEDFIKAIGDRFPMHPFTRKFGLPRG